MEPIPVMLVDDNPLFLNAAVQFLKACTEVTVVGSCSSGQEALEKVQELKPRIILLDMMMPGTSGLNLIGPLKQLLPDTAIIALTVMDAPNFRKAALSAGADAFVSKATMHVDLLPLIRRIGEGQYKQELPQATLTGSQNDEAPASQTVLLMEDDPSQSRLYAKALRKSGYTVYEAHTLQEARDLLAQHHFDVFLCDIHMGRERGTDLLREQGDKLRNNGTQIVIVSADPAYRCMAEEMGVEFYLEKPISIAALVRLVDRLTTNGKS